MLFKRDSWSKVAKSLDWVPLLSALYIENNEIERSIDAV